MVQNKKRQALHALAAAWQRAPRRPLPWLLSMLAAAAVFGAVQMEAEAAFVANAPAHSATTAGVAQATTTMSTTTSTTASPVATWDEIYALLQTVLAMIAQLNGTATDLPMPMPTPTATATPAATATAIPTATPAPSPTPDGCERVPAERLSLLDERVGFAAHVNGGADGCVYHVTNANDAGPGSLREGAEAGDQWVVFDGDFTIELASPIQVAANTTIDGRGRAITITNRGLYLSSTAQQNVILENLTIRRVSGTGHDAVRAWNGASDFWFDHLTIEDVSDEYIDIGRTNEGRTTPVNGTVSYVRFNPGATVNTNEKALIIGAPAGAATNHLIQVTVHHNYYNGTRQRHPLAAGTKVHSFNNVIKWRLWGAQARYEAGAATGADVVSEGDVFDASIVHDGFAPYGVRLVNSGTRVRVSDPLLLHGAAAESSDPARAFTPRYVYALTSAAEANATVPALAGAR